MCTEKNSGKITLEKKAEKKTGKKLSKKI